MIARPGRLQPIKSQKTIATINQEKFRLNAKSRGASRDTDGDRKFKKISSSGHRSPINIVSGRQSGAEGGLGSPGLRSSLASSHMRIR